MRISPRTLTAVATRPGRRPRGVGSGSDASVCSSVSSAVAATVPCPYSLRPYDALLDERVRLALAARAFLDHLAPDDQPVLARELRCAGGEGDVAAGFGETRAPRDGVQHAG